MTTNELYELAEMAAYLRKLAGVKSEEQPELATALKRMAAHAERIMQEELDGVQYEREHLPLNEHGEANPEAESRLDAAEAELRRVLRRTIE